MGSVAVKPSELGAPPPRTCCSSAQASKRNVESSGLDGNGGDALAVCVCNVAAGRGWLMPDPGKTGERGRLRRAPLLGVEGTSGIGRGTRWAAVTTKDDCRSSAEFCLSTFGWRLPEGVTEVARVRALSACTLRLGDRAVDDERA